jgi:hypothetical protein
MVPAGGTGLQKNEINKKNKNNKKIKKPTALYSRYRRTYVQAGGTSWYRPVPARFVR